MNTIEMVKEKINRRMGLIREYHKNADHALNGGKDAAKAQREMIKAQEQQCEIQRDYFEFLTQPFWNRLQTKEKIVIIVLVVGGRDIIHWLGDLINIAKPFLF